MKTFQTLIGGISSPALAAVRTAHGPSEEHTSVCCWREGGRGEGKQRRWQTNYNKNSQLSRARCRSATGRKRKRIEQDTSFQNKLKGGALSQRGVFVSRRPALQRVAAPCAPCNHKVTEMGAASYEGSLQRLQWSRPETCVVLGMPPPPPPRDAMMSDAQTGNFAKQREVCVVGLATRLKSKRGGLGLGFKREHTHTLGLSARLNPDPCH